MAEGYCWSDEDIKEIDAVCAEIKKAGIPFDDDGSMGSFGIAVEPSQAERARKLIRDFCRKHHIDVGIVPGPKKPSPVSKKMMRGIVGEWRESDASPAGGDWWIELKADHSFLSEISTGWKYSGTWDYVDGSLTTYANGSQPNIYHFDRDKQGTYLYIHRKSLNIRWRKSSP